MKLHSLMMFNAILFIALGIAFAVYGPLVSNAFGMLEISGADGAAYWFTASFVRLIGVGFFGFGFLLWAVRNLVSGDIIPKNKMHRIVLSLLITNIVGLFVAVTQQWQIWVNIAGWLTIGLFLLLTLGYTYFLIRGYS